MRRFTSFARNLFVKKSEEVAEMSPKRYFINPLIETVTVNEEVVITEHKLKETVQNVIGNISNNFKPTERNAEDGVYLGTAGVSYMFYHISKIPTFIDQKDVLLKSGLEYLKPALKVALKCAPRTKDVPAFILGNSGIYAVASVLFNALGNEKECLRYKELFNKAGNIVKEKRFLECGSDELFVGRAGYICGAIWLSKALNTSVPQQDLHEICSVMVASGREYSQRHKSPSPLMYAYYNVEYLGFLDANPKDALAIKQSIDFLLSLQDSEGNFPAAMDEVHLSKNELLHWCHGAPGIIYLMAKAYLTWNDVKYLNSCIKMADIVWKKGLLKKGPGICHGVAGNGYVFLLMYRLTNEHKYLHKALSFVNFLENDKFKREARIPDHPYSLYEGIAGTACFVADCTNPIAAAFPFSDIF
ncbi:lanC-like protein 3 homolog [Agrilus planipennis]|uniref:LanC-like protein 3 homolog n=1 Tax=Agrilus planipennis TaxID=224129 RepID=A0A1W4XDT1_AGRPL|nr:lanC-like protein 3 homolog [Agrilus planipennis]